jgi:hypothetical protein
MEIEEEKPKANGRAGRHPTGVIKRQSRKIRRQKKGNDRSEKIALFLQTSSLALGKSAASRSCAS